MQESLQRILIVDDDAMSVDFMMRHINASLTCEVFSFQNPLEAYSWAKENKCDLAIIDYHMPEMSGVDLVRKIRCLDDYASLPIMLITSDDTRGTIPEAFDAGFTDYIFKPFQRTEFFARVNNALNLRSATKALESEKENLECKVKEATRELLDKEVRYRMAIESTNDGIWDWDLKASEVFYSKKWCEILGYQEDEVPSSSLFWTSRVKEEDLYILTGAIDNHIMGKADLIDCTYRMIHKKGYDVWVQTQGKALRDETGQAVRLIGAHADISELKESQEELARSALHDTLTGLPNRSLLMERLQQAFLRFKRDPQALFTLMFIDLDKFKEINDTYGHGAGDKILKDISDVLTSSARDLDTVARLGGDEYVVLLDGTSSEKAARKYLDRVYGALKDPVVIAGYELKLGLSAGVVLVSAAYANPDQVLQDADVALYEAKERGRNQAVFFEEGMKELPPRKKQLLESLGDALNKGEMEVYYQPIVSLETQRHLGYEALLRWNHPEMGIVSPEDFIPLAERNDMIIKLSNFVMSVSCKQLAFWQNKFNRPDLFMCINVTSPQVFQPTFLEDMHGDCMRLGIKPENLVLEFSELCFAQIYKWDSSFLESLRCEGFNLALDDYGEGRASIRSLVDYKMNYLKIDRSLSLEILGDERKRRLFDLMIHLGIETNLRIVVEGIQTPEILDYVARSQAQLGQGYLFSKPVQVKDIEKMLKKMSKVNQKAS